MRTLGLSLLCVCSTLSLAGCSNEPDGGGSNDGGSSGAAGSNAAGSAAATGGGGEAGNGAGPSGECRAGSVTDEAPLFSALAGTYMFAPFSAKCEVAGHTLQKDRPYAVTLSDEDRAIRVVVDASTTLEYVWDGLGDVACKSDTVSSIEIDGNGSFARISLITSPVSPGTLLLGSCGFTGE